MTRDTRDEAGVYGEQVSNTYQNTSFVGHNG